tara:strand:+ start:7969 stop:8103 length:135 start_codon:yes stop_codon:yes gene_type:complete
MCEPPVDAVKNGYIYIRSFEHLDVTLDIDNNTEVLNWKNILLGL